MSNHTKTGQFSIPSEIRVSRAKTANAAKQAAWKLKREERLQSLSFDLLSISEKRERILREQDYSCFECSIGSSWNGKPLKFELDHINGDRTNNQRSNLRFVCPNCHSQTDTYKVGNNKNVGKRTYDDQELINALLSSSSAYQAMKSIGMNPHGGNYTRLRRLIQKEGLNLGYSV